MYMCIPSFIFKSPSVVADIRDDETRTTGPPGKLLAVIPDASGNKRPYEIYRLSAITLYAEHVPPFLSACPNIIIYNETCIFWGGPEGGGGVRDIFFFFHTNGGRLPTVARVYHRHRYYRVRRPRTSATYATTPGPVSNYAAQKTRPLCK